jgi:hypothetical protein
MEGIEFRIPSVHKIQFLEKKIAAVYSSILIIESTKCSG